jgi:peptidoglycan/LPS O-acetylase OafA/YrhL
MKYRPDIDGLRSVAVLSVLFFHLGATWLPGGFIGVDVFFVISGYLITRNLTVQIERGGGLSLIDFYDRRIRRIAPAALTLLVVTLLAGYFLLMPGDYASLGKSTIYSAFGAGNLFFFWHTGYFDREASLQPLLHMWSLGVEEQFYAAWPMLLALILWIAKHRRGLTIGMIAAVSAISFVLCLQELTTSPKAAFYLPYNRAWELGVGALVVFVPTLRSRLTAEAAGAAGLLMIAFGLFTLRQSDPFPGLNAVAPVLGSAFLVWPRSTSWSGQILSMAPLRWLGLISYSLYLWHWPLIVLFRHWANSATPTAAEAISLTALSIALGWISWRFIEQPFRRSGRPIISIPVGIGAATAAAAVGLVVLVNHGFDRRIGSDMTALSSLDVMWQWHCPRLKQIQGLDQSYCQFGAPWEKSAVKAIVWGDSHAEHMAPIIESAAEDKSASFLLYRECPAALGGHARRIWAEVPDYVHRCTDMRQRAVRTLNADPSINLVILSASWSNLGNVVSQDGAIKGNPGRYDIIGYGVRSLIEETAAPGRRFILIADVPQLRSDPIPCATSNYTRLLRRHCQRSDETVSTSDFRSFQGRIYDIFRKIAAERDDTDAVFPGDALCTGKWCETDLNGEFLYRDASHIRRNLLPATRRLYAEKVGLTKAITSSIQILQSSADRIERQATPESQAVNQAE